MQTFAVDADNPFTLSYVIMKNGIPYKGNTEVTYISKDTRYVIVRDNKLYAIGSSINDNATVEIELQLNEFPEIKIPIKIQTGEPHVLSYYIAGPDKLRLANREVHDNENLYQLFSTDGVLQFANWEISNNALATIEFEKDENEQIVAVRIYTNTDNDLGQFDLIAYIDGNEVQRKQIQIIPLW